MFDQIVAFLLSLGIVGALISWGMLCGVWHRANLEGKSLPTAESFRERAEFYAESCEK